MISTGFVLASVFVGFVVLAGIFLLFVKAENIERNVLVACMTLATALISIALLAHDARHPYRFGSGALILICFLAVTGFVAGRVLDFYLGPRNITVKLEDATLGADLAD